MIFNKGYLSWILALTSTQVLESGRDLYLVQLIEQPIMNPEFLQQILYLFTFWVDIIKVKVLN